MSYRNILVQLDSRPACRHRIAVALELAERYGARVTGLATTGMLVLPYAMDMAPSGALVVEWQEAMQKLARSAADSFEAAARQRGLARIATKVAEGSEVAAVTQAGR